MPNVQYFNDANDAQVAAQQDWLRSSRQFVSLLAANFLGDDQLFPDTDANPTNSTGQYTVYSPSAGSVAIEGQGAAVSASGGVQIPTGTLVLVLGGLALFALMH